jgi:RNA polymerase sigma-70 factor (ECF subfamily)
MQSETTLTESEALRRARDGDAVAFEWLYHLHLPRVYALCLRMAKNPTQAEDLTQETFLAVFRGIRHFRGQSAFTTWLHRVTRNTVLMFFRKKRLKEVSLEEIAERQKEDGSLREWGKPDLHLESIADRLLLQSAIAKLSATLRKTLLLHVVHGYGHEEIAGLLGKAPGTSKSRVHKARLRMRETLKKFRRVDGQRTVHAPVGSKHELATRPSDREGSICCEPEKRSTQQRVSQPTQDKGAKYYDFQDQITSGFRGSARPVLHWKSRSG